MVKARTWDIRELNLNGVHRDKNGYLILCKSCPFDDPKKDCEYCAAGVCEARKIVTDIVNYLHGKCSLNEWQELAELARKAID